MLENPFPVPICLFFLFFFPFVLTKTRKEFLRTSKPNVAMQHSWEFVLEAHILNIKPTTDLQEWQKTFRTRKKKKRVSEKEKSINVCSFWCCFPRGQNRMWGPGKLGPFQAERSLKNLLLTYESSDALTPNVRLALAAAVSSIFVSLEQLIWAREDDKQRLGYHHVCTAFPSVLTTCRCQECSHEPLKPCLWAFSKHRLVRKKSEWLELTPPPIHICKHTHLLVCTCVYICEGCVGLHFPAGWKTGVELEEWK